MKEGTWGVGSVPLSRSIEEVETETGSKSKQGSQSRLYEENTSNIYDQHQSAHLSDQIYRDQCNKESNSSDSIEQNEKDINALRALEKCLLAKRKLSSEQQILDNNVSSNLSDDQDNCIINTSEATYDSGNTKPTIKKRTQQQVKSKQQVRRIDDKDVNLSFCGCGFLGIYHVGVASCFHRYAPQLSKHKISGSSAGALVALSHICGDLQLAYFTTDILAVAIEARSHTLGSFHPSFDIQAQVRESLERGLPENAYLLASGKLHVSLTRVEDGENVIVNEFNSNEDLIQALLCSCFIPFWSGIRLPKYKGVAYIDGGFSNNLLVLDEKTVTVSPFSGEADICPEDDTLNLLQINLSNTSFSLSPSNLYRLSHALLPPEPEVLSDLCKQGFADGIRYLQRMNLISCTKCLEIRSSLLVTAGGEDMEEVFSSANTITTTTTTTTPKTAVPTTNEHRQISRKTSAYDIHAIVLEQQEQETLEIRESRRRGSIVSIRSNRFDTISKHTINSQASTDSNDGNNNITPAVSLYNLLNGIESDVNIIDNDDDIEDCKECVLARQRAFHDPLPKQFRDRIHQASDKVNKSLTKWLYSHRPVKYLSYLMVPYYVPIDLTVAIIYRFWKKLPVIRKEVTDCMNQVLDFLIIMLRRMQTRSTSAMLMGFGTSWEEDVMAYEKELIMKEQKSASQVLHHHHHHHHHHHTTTTTSAATAVASTTVPITAAAAAAAATSSSSSSSVSVSSSAVASSSNHHYCQNNHHHHPHASGSACSTKELHSLEDTFDSIVDVTSNQEARIFAYYFRDAKNRLQVTEIFDLEQVAAAAAASSLSQVASSTSESSG